MGNMHISICPAVSIKPFGKLSPQSSWICDLSPAFFRDIVRAHAIYILVESCQQLSLPPSGCRHEKRRKHDGDDDDKNAARLIWMNSNSGFPLHRDNTPKESRRPASFGQRGACSLSFNVRQGEFGKPRLPLEEFLLARIGVHLPLVRVDDNIALRRSRLRGEASVEGVEMF